MGKKNAQPNGLDIFWTNISALWYSNLQPTPTTKKFVDLFFGLVHFSFYESCAVYESGRETPWLFQTALPAQDHSLIIRKANTNLFMASFIAS